MVHWTYILSEIRFESILLILRCNCFNPVSWHFHEKKKKKKLHSHAILALSATCSFPHFSICHLRHYFIHRSPRNALRISKIHANSSVTNSFREAKFTRNRFWHLRALVRKEMLKNKSLRDGPQHCRHGQARQPGSGQPPPPPRPRSSATATSAPCRLGGAGGCRRRGGRAAAPTGRRRAVRAVLGLRLRPGLERHRWSR